MSNQEQTQVMHKQKQTITCDKKEQQDNTPILVMWPTDHMGKALGFELCSQNDGKWNSEQVANKVLQC